MSKLGWSRWCAWFGAGVEDFPHAAARVKGEWAGVPLHAEAGCLDQEFESRGGHWNARAERGGGKTWTAPRAERLFFRRVAAGREAAGRGGAFVYSCRTPRV